MTFPSVIVSPALKRFIRSLWMVSALFVVYGTTIPFDFELSAHGKVGMEALEALEKFPRTEREMKQVDMWGDILQNVLLFLPFGFLGFLSMGKGYTNLWKIAVVTGAGFLLSCGVEFLQLYSPVRHTSPVDVLTNTMGALSGAAFAYKTYKVFSRFLQDEKTRRYLKVRTAYPLAVFLVLTTVGAWMPFDFSLVRGDNKWIVKGLVRDFFDFAWPGDHGLIFVQYVIFSLALYRFLADMGQRHPLWMGGVYAALLAVFLELGQVVVVSRTPQFQDILTACMGALAALALIKQRNWRAYPWVWAVLWSTLIFASAAMMSLHPFRPADAYTGFNFIPFFAYEDRTGFLSLHYFLHMGVAFFPLGFLFAYLFKPTRASVASVLAVAGAMALALEFAQGFFHGVHADITDVMGAMAGAVLGHLAGGRGWSSYERMLEETELKERVT